MNPSIELFRAIAALMVLTAHYDLFFTSHMNYLHYLSTGVDLFFVVSGFVFGYSIFSDRAFYLKPYIVRRFSRIYPLYAFSLVFYYFFTRSDPHKLLYFIKHLLFLQTTTSIREVAFFNGAYWTLPVEVEFYMLVPVLAMYARRYKNLVPVVLISGFIFRLLLPSSPRLPQEVGTMVLMVYHLPGILTEFGIGMLLYKAHSRWKGPSVSVAVRVITFSLGVFVFSMLALYLVLHGYKETNIILIRYTDPYFCLSSAVGFALLLFPFLDLFTDKKSSFASFSIFAGSLSYGVYLFHTLAPTLLARAHLLPSSPLSAYGACLIVTLTLAAASHYLIEAPLRSYGASLSRGMSAALMSRMKS